MVVLDPIYLLLAFVAVEIAVLSYGLFVLLPRRLAELIPEAEAMIDRQKKQLGAELGALLGAAIGKTLDEVLNEDTVKQMSRDAATVAGEVLAARFGGLAQSAIKGTARRARSDPMGSLLDVLMQGAISKFTAGAGNSPQSTTSPGPLSPGSPLSPAGVPYSP